MNKEKLKKEAAQTKYLTLDKLCDLETHLKDVEEILKDLVEKLVDAHDVRDEVKVIANEMSECVIPVNIAMRKSELEKFSERLDIMIDNFEHLRSADEDFAGDSAAEKEMRRMVLNFDTLL